MVCEYHRVQCGGGGSKIDGPFQKKLLFKNWCCLKIGGGHFKKWRCLKKLVGPFKKYVVYYQGQISDKIMMVLTGLVLSLAL